jgi:hypothetical protein
MDHLVGDRHDSWRLNDAVGVAVDGGHHRAGQPARDAAVVETAVGVRVGRSASAGFSRCRPRRLSRLPFGSDRRDTSVDRIDDEPRHAAFGVVMAVEPDPARAADLAGELLLAGAVLDGEAHLQKLLARDVFDAAPHELFGPLERCACFPQVGVVALNIGIAPGRARRGRRRWRRGGGRFPRRRLGEGGTDPCDGNESRHDTGAAEDWPGHRGAPF